MYDFVEVDTYLNKLSGTDHYFELFPEEQEKLVFTAYEKLSLHYSESLLTTRVIALQTLYMANKMGAKGEEATALRNIREAGAKSYSIDGVSVTFEESDAFSDISPEVAAILTRQTKRAYVGRLV